MLSFRTILFFLVVLPYTFLISILSSLASLVDRSGNAYLKFARIWGKGCLWILGIKVHIFGEHHYHENQVYVIASNHASMADIPIILACVRLNLRMIAKSELGKIPFFGWSLWLGDFILIDRKNKKKSLASLEEAKEKIRSGKSIHIFADGTRDVEGKIQPLKQGAFSLACQTNTPVLPVTILGSHLLTEKKSFKIHCGEVFLAIDAPLYPKGPSKQQILELRENTYRVFLSNYENRSKFNVLKGVKYI